MLYDKRWDAKPSFAGFVSWLEAQDPNARYAYMPCATCAIGKYLKSIGTSYGAQVWKMDDELMNWNMSVTHPAPWTFGAALARAKALQP